MIWGPTEMKKEWMIDSTKRRNRGRHKASSSEVLAEREEAQGDMYLHLWNLWQREKGRGASLLSKTSVCMDGLDRKRHGDASDKFLVIDGGFVMQTEDKEEKGRQT